jgi:hypothetical protein
LKGPSNEKLPPIYFHLYVLTTLYVYTWLREIKLDKYARNELVEGRDKRQGSDVGIIDDAAQFSGR